LTKALVSSNTLIILDVVSEAVAAVDLYLSGQRILGLEAVILILFPLAAILCVKVLWNNDFC
jgi:hypothetical protein